MDGTFAVWYHCAPEDQNLQARFQYLDTYGFWQMSAESKVLWWGSPNETPENVLELLEFLVRQYPDLTAAFKALEGENGNGKLSLREFEEGLKAIKCRKFAGDNEAQCIRSIYRFLDPSMDGQISEKEWSLLELIWKELKLSILEFVHFCIRTFGEDLKETFEVLDAEGSGEITEEEWTKAIKTIGYFGSTEPIFHYLDKDDEGTISLTEFMELGTFRQNEISMSQC